MGALALLVVASQAQGQVVVLSDVAHRTRTQLNQVPERKTYLVRPSSVTNPQIRTALEVVRKSPFIKVVGRFADGWKAWTPNGEQASVDMHDIPAKTYFHAYVGDRFIVISSIIRSSDPMIRNLSLRPSQTFDYDYSNTDQTQWYRVDRPMLTTDIPFEISISERTNTLLATDLGSKASVDGVQFTVTSVARALHPEVLADQYRVEIEGRKLDHRYRVLPVQQDNSAVGNHIEIVQTPRHLVAIDLSAGHTLSTSMFVGQVDKDFPSFEIVRETMIEGLFGKVAMEPKS